MGDGLFQKIKALIIHWLALHLPDCKQMTRSLGESLDRESTWRQRLIMKLHMYTCEACERYLEQVTFIRDALHAHGECPPEEPEASLHMSDETKAKIKALLRNSAGIAF